MINFISFHRDNRKAIKLKRTENLRNLYLSGLVDFLEEQFGGATVVLFGSYGRGGEDAKNSDIDIVVIGRKSKHLELERYERVLFRKIKLDFYESWSVIHWRLEKTTFLAG